MAESSYKLKRILLCSTCTLPTGVSDRQLRERESMQAFLFNILQASAERFPDRAAVQDEQGESLTYEQLRSRAIRIARLLEEVGVCIGDRVGICLPKSLASVSCVFGVLAAEGAYVPVDASAPKERSVFIFTDCGVSAILTDKSSAPGLLHLLRDACQVESHDIGGDIGSSDGLVLIVPRWLEKDARVKPAAGVAYILYTSGSTGRPKGVVHTHDSARSFVEWASTLLGVTEADIFSSHAPFHFDLSIFDLYVPIMHGARVVLIGEALGKQPQKLARIIESQNISIWYSTPAILRLLLEFGDLASQPKPRLRSVIFAGEVFPLKYLKSLLDIWPDAEYYNFYGPTETNVCTYFKVPVTLEDVPYKTLPIGWPCSDDQCRVVDPSDQDVNPGDEGELVVSGGSVMQSYWNLPERNRDAFIEDQEGRLWYRTGDLVTEHPTFGYMYVGRRDRMVKRRGYRIELGEIEAALYKHEMISEAAVVSKTVDDEVSIIAVLACGSESRPSKIALKRFCAQNLISYMIPDDFRFVDELPKTSTDKVDYQRILEMA